MSSAYIEQIKQNIRALISQKRFKEAYLKCKNLIAQYSEEEEFVKLKEEIENAVKLENEIIVDQKLEILEDLFSKQHYTEVLEAIPELLKISPNNKKILKFQKRVQESYRDYIEEKQKIFFKKEKKRLDQLLEKDATQLIEELFLLERNNHDKSEIVEDIINNYRDKLIEKKIKEKKELLNSDKEEAIQNFLEQLRNIDKHNPRIEEIGNIIKRKKSSHQINKTNEFIYIGTKHLETLMKLKKFDKAIKAAQELLNIDPENKTIIDTLQKAEKKLFIQTKNLLVQSMISEAKVTQEEYKNNKNSFIKL